MPKLDTEKQTITGTWKELGVFVFFSIMTIGGLLCGFGISFRLRNPIPFMISVALLSFTYFMLPAYRWTLYELFHGMASGGTYLGQSMIGGWMYFELPDGTQAKGRIVRCSPALSWRVLWTPGNRWYLVSMPFDQPIGHRRWTVTKDVTEEWLSKLEEA